MSAKKAAASAARTQTYRAAYAQLARIASELEDGETDLDQVLALLSEAQATYAVCRERIEALRAALAPLPETAGAAPAGLDPAATETDRAEAAEDEEDSQDEDDDDFF